MKGPVLEAVQKIEALDKVQVAAMQLQQGDRVIAVLVHPACVSMQEAQAARRTAAELKDALLEMGVFAVTAALPEGYRLDVYKVPT